MHQTAAQVGIKEQRFMESESGLYDSTKKVEPRCCPAAGQLRTDYIIHSADVLLRFFYNIPALPGVENVTVCLHTTEESQKDAEM